MRKSKKLFKFFVLLFILVVATFRLHSQKSHLGNWMSLNATYSFSNMLILRTDLHHRSYDGFSDLETFKTSFGIGSSLPKSNASIFLNLEYLQTENYIDASDFKIKNDEIRIDQQLNTQIAFGRIFVKNRYQIEERFFKNDFRIRFRYQISLKVPINNKEIMPQTIFFSAYNELFINGKLNYFDRIRVFIGLGYKLNGVTILEAGYMNQILPTFNRDQLFLSFTFNMKHKSNP